MPANGPMRSACRKSGVSGCIMAVIPGQVGIGIYSPPLDAQGNSVRGIKVCQSISNEFELHAFNNRTNVRSVIRRVYRGDRVRSIRAHRGDQAKLLFVLARGSVSVQIRVPTQAGDKRRRAASLGPGLTFGEMALLGGGARSADVVADEKVNCYGLSVQ
jgi:hypothetical protein